MHTVDKGSNFAPRPLPEFVDYEPWEGKDTNAEFFFQSLLNLKHDVRYFNALFDCLV